jgi:hypothetical protein
VFTQSRPDVGASADISETKGPAMDFNQLKAQAEDLIEKRGGTDALKEDAEELKNIATGEGSVSDKAKAAAEALKDPGKPGA